MKTTTNLYGRECLYQSEEDLIDIKGIPVLMADFNRAESFYTVVDESRTVIEIRLQTNGQVFKIFRQT